MKERPILFSAPMVRALLAGTKTQTRRIVKPQPAEWASTYNSMPGCAEHFWCEHDYDDDMMRHWPSYEKGLPCPYGQPGDRLWVKETGWQRPERTPRMMREGADTWAPYYFDADGLSEQDHTDFKAWGFKRRPSIFMPRECGRITLEVTGVRVERLNDISEADALAEGVDMDLPIEMPMDGVLPCTVTTKPRSARQAYMHLWEQINGPGSWAANPWVWVVEFKRIEGGLDNVG